MTLISIPTRTTQSDDIPEGVTLTSAQTISGSKTFSAVTTFNGGINIGNTVLTATASELNLLTGVTTLARPSTLLVKPTFSGSNSYTINVLDRYVVIDRAPGTDTFLALPGKDAVSIGHEVSIYIFQYGLNLQITCNNLLLNSEEWMFNPPSSGNRILQFNNLVGELTFTYMGQISVPTTPYPTQNMTNKYAWVVRKPYTQPAT